MATLSVTNVSTADLYIGDMYVNVPAGKTVDVERKASELSTMVSLQKAIAAGTVAVSIAYSAAEKASGLVDESDVSAKQNATGLSGLLTVRLALVAGVTGLADDVTLYAAGSLPYTQLRVLDAFAFVSTAVNPSTLQLRTLTGGTGALLAEMDSSATGRAGQTTTVINTATISNDGVVGLFVRRSNDNIAGEVIVTLRVEAQVSTLTGSPSDSAAALDSVTGVIS